MKNFSRSLAMIGLATLVGAFAATAAAQGVGTEKPKAPPAGREAPPAPGARDGATERDPRRDAARAAAKIGTAAPDFSLTDSKGKTHKLADYRGKIVVLQWINPDCPVCQRVMTDGVTANAMKGVEAAANGTVWLFVNSTHYMDAVATNAYLDKNKSTTPALLDANGAVGKLYGARTTPHIFIIDDKGVLRYDGAIDDDPDGSKAKAKSAVINYPVAAVKQIRAGESVSPDTVRPYGCSVKYAPGSDAPKGREGRGTPPSRDGGTTPPSRGSTPPPTAK